MVTEALNGMMKIELIEGRFTRDCDMIGKMDPYVVMQYREEIWKSAVHNSGGKTPSWENQHHTFTIKYIGDDLHF